MHDDELLEQFRSALIGNGWSIVRSDVPEPLPEPLNGVDETLRRFVASTRSCESADGAVWFIGADDYARDDDEGWNFLQKQISEPSAEDAPEWLSEIAQFWSEHVPFAIHARGDYGYLAVARTGTVVCGFAPELEDARVVAESYGDFVRRVVDECASGSGDFYDLWIKR